MTMENSSMKEILEQNENLFKLPKGGQIIKGKVIQVQEEQVIVNIGYKSDGIIPRNEISNDYNTDLHKVIKEGDEIEVFVIKEDDGDGNVLLSKKRVDIRKDWENLIKIKKMNKSIRVRTSEAVKGGIIAYYNEIRGFIPASHLSNNYVSDLNEFVDKILDVKVLDLDKKNNRVVFSHKEILKEVAEKKKKELWDTLEKDKVVEGIVKQFTNFGAFIDLGGVDGLVHISEISWGRIKHPSDVLSIGDKVEVYIQDIDRKSEKISLSLKKTIKNPWDNIELKYNVGDIVEGVVLKLVDFGAFIELEPGIEGLVHISNISDKHISKPSEILTIGSKVQAKIIDINKEDKRIGLSIKEAKADEEINNYIENTENQEKVTIGDIVDLKMDRND